MEQSLTKCAFLKTNRLNRRYFTQKRLGFTAILKGADNMLYNPRGYWLAGHINSHSLTL
jgi:hypothetical protein